MAMWLSRLERGTHNAEVGGSSPPIATTSNEVIFPISLLFIDDRIYDQRSPL